ncbi:hypothetical protein Goarm_010913 [Gossypium armourianum]|uniref:Sm domain-containing protein n=3 Tax=Gossypium TaxID=3633 RepID=A0A7J9IV64_9ROSI|nr:hypothetical protein [Gossypium armourianum]
MFFSYFKDLVGREVTVELKNDLAIRGTLHSVDQYLNIKLENTRVVDQDKYPHMMGVTYQSVRTFDRGFACELFHCNLLKVLEIKPKRVKTNVKPWVKWNLTHGDTWSCICQVGLLMLDDRIMLYLKEFHVNVWHWIAQCKTGIIIDVVKKI